MNRVKKVRIACVSEYLLWKFRTSIRSSRKSLLKIYHMLGTVLGIGDVNMSIIQSHLSRLKVTGWEERNAPVFVR